MGGATAELSAARIQPALFQCRTRLCGWCNRCMYSSPRDILGFNAARGFVGGATARRRRSQKAILVSMPHAALWVVQRSWERSRLVAQSGFNAARGFVGGATVPICAFGLARCSFNAARGFVGGATIR